jgi:predicted DNA-binding transcriptional regulator AlpA
MNTPVYIRKQEVTKRFGWSPTTIWRKVKQGCFPCYRPSGRDTMFDLNEILYYLQGTRVGDFDQKGEN